MKNTLFASNLKRVRKKLGLTQVEFAKKLKISPSAVGMYEQGRREPDNEMLSKICLELNVSTDFMLGMEKHKFIEETEVKDVIYEFARLLEERKDLVDNGILISKKNKDKLILAIKKAAATAAANNNKK